MGTSCNEKGRSMCWSKLLKDAHGRGTKGRPNGNWIDNTNDCLREDGLSGEGAQYVGL